MPAWVGIKTDGRTVIVAPVKDALEAVQTISRYKNSDALVLIAWDGLITALDNGQHRAELDAAELQRWKPSTSRKSSVRAAVNPLRRLTTSNCASNAGLRSMGPR
jgi:hypothetical protein